MIQHGPYSVGFRVNPVRSQPIGCFPGTVLLFVYAFLLKTYFAVILASISISLGMAFVLFVSSFLGVSLNKASQKSAKFVNILEIASPIFMFILGLLLFLNANKF